LIRWQETKKRTTKDTKYTKYTKSNKGGGANPNRAPRGYVSGTLMGLVLWELSGS
jgi:hypothetical protein